MSDINEEIKEKKICEFCGKMFVPKTPKQRCCGKKCKRKKFGSRRLQRIREKYGRRKRRKNISNICQYCGREFFVTIDHRKYCSTECRLKNNAIRNKLKLK